MRLLNIIMYHNILGPDKRPGFHGLSAEDFAAQMRHLAANFAVISVAELAQRLADGASLPARAALVTFDDGLASQYRHALPVLRALGLPAAFYPTVRPVREGVLLDVSKIHLILGSLPAPGELLARLRQWPDCARRIDELDTPEFRAWLAQGYPRDDLSTALAKYMLQTDLPEDRRATVLDELFAEVVGEDEATAARDVYMGLDELRELRAAGMDLGVHGRTHRWFTDLDEAAREEELDASLDLLRDCGRQGGPWSIAYPSGMYDAPLMELLRSRGCAVGLGVTPGEADLDRDNPLALPRIDANVPGMERVQ